MKIYAWLAIAILSSSFSCSNQDVPCTNMGASVGIIGFDSTEIDRVMTYKYPQDGQFATIIDSSSVKLHYGFQKSDTLRHSGRLESGFDYIVATAPTMRTWRITNFNLYYPTRKRYEYYGADCGIAAYTVDGIPFNSTDVFNQNTRIVLHR